MSDKNKEHVYVFILISFLRRKVFFMRHEPRNTDMYDVLCIIGPDTVTLSLKKSHTSAAADRRLE